MYLTCFTHAVIAVYALTLTTNFLQPRAVIIKVEDYSGSTFGACKSSVQLAEVLEER